MTSKSIAESDVLDAYMQFATTGKGVMLLEAIRRCGQHGIAIPPIVHEEFQSALRRYRVAEARTLDEAFSTKREKGWDQSAHKNAYKKAWDVWRETFKCHESGEPIDMELHEKVGKQFSISASTARKYWREVSKTLTKT